ncbi:MAG TPA: YdcF family protein [Micropepsaceae bacterium]|nr:YdcF family protein [Micropepsaceae bacterium]
MLFGLGIAALVSYAIGFSAFVLNLPAPRAGSAAKADAIVALTGEGGRLAPAVTLLEKGDGQRLLITGVNRVLSKRALKTLLHGGPAFDCCADLGFAALDTRGNAAEAARWARAHRYGSLIIVTTNYHMPRSLVEFGAEMPDVKLVPYPVAADPVSMLSWGNAKRLQGEYVKYLASVVRVSVAGALAHG